MKYSLMLGLAVAAGCSHAASAQTQASDTVVQDQWFTGTLSPTRDREYRGLDRLLRTAARRRPARLCRNRARNPNRTKSRCAG